jgi:tRNA C32,U32 (ribose-2'-O)-methylase TrmJ
MSLNRVVIILANTKYPGNIGSAARAMFNMGLTQLVLAAPQCAINDESYRMAKGGRAILESAKIFRSVKSALKGIRFCQTGKGSAIALRPAPRTYLEFAQQKVGPVG